MENPLPRSIEVGCAIIRRNGRILISRRRTGDHLGGLWEFPGGKRQDIETLETCLEREIQEELGIQIQTGPLLKRIDHSYPDRQVCLYFYECRWVSGTLQPHACQEFRWVLPSELPAFDFPPADTDILKLLQSA